jgi:monovalent cation:proton antiporter-2 (CPA2) family protein
MNTSLYLADILILLIAAVIAVPLFQRLGLGSVLGYLAAGATVGPWGFGFIDEVSEIRHIAEFGVVFLLFLIGIELKPARLWAMRRSVFGLGAAQVILTGLAISALSYTAGQSLRLSIIIGFGLALSSTAFGLQLLSERGELNTKYGRTALSVLLFQDLAVVPLLALVSLLAANSTTLLVGIEFAVLEGVLAVTAVILAGRYLLTPLLQHVATSRTAEIFTAAAVIAVLGTAWLMEAAGLSLALGAFLAGLMLADSRYRHQIVADIEPFRGILLGLFFMGVGMSIDFGLLGDRGLLIAGLALALLLMKTAILWTLTRVFGNTTVDSTRASLLLSQSGEFGFVLFGLAVVTGLMTPDLFNLLVLMIALTMITTPLMPTLGEYFSGPLTGSATADRAENQFSEAGPSRIVIAGYGRVGRRIANLLEASKTPYVAVEIDDNRVAAGRKENSPVYFGDATRADVLRAAGAGNADALVCTLNKPIPALRMVRIMRQHYPDVPIFARGHNREHCDELLEAGATLAVSETLEASLQLASAVLDRSGMSSADTEAVIDQFRAKHYE